MTWRVPQAARAIPDPGPPRLRLVVRPEWRAGGPELIPIRPAAGENRRHALAPPLPVWQGSPRLAGSPWLIPESGMLP
jgi:hypothetical protein